MINNVKKYLPNTTIIWSIALFALCTILLSSFFIAILFLRPVGDDYGFYNLYHSADWVQNVLYALAHENGRFAQNITGAVTFGILGMKTAYLIPLATMLLLTFILFIIARRYTAALGLKDNRVVALVLTVTSASCFLVFGWGLDTRSLATFQTTLWAIGIITYTVPFLLLVLTLLYYPKIDRRHTWRLTLLAIVLYALGMFNETQTVVVGTIAALLLFLSFFRYFNPLLPRFRKEMLVAFLSSIAAIATIYLSPANTARRHVAKALTITHETPAIIIDKYTTMLSFQLSKTDIILCIGIGLAVSLVVWHYFLAKQKKQTHIQLLYIGLSLIGVALYAGLISTILVTLGYGVQSPIMPRTLLITLFSFSLGIFLIGIYSGLGILSRDRRSVGMAAVLGISIVCIAYSLPVTISKVTNQLSNIIAYSRSWDSENARIRSLSIPDRDKTYYMSDENSGIGDGFNLSCKNANPDATWLPDAMEKYYGIREICSEGDLKAQ